jgi:hypothetical protein
MPLAHPQLINDAAEEGTYFGMRAAVRPAAGKDKGLRPKYTFKQIMKAIDRTAQAWSAWTGGDRPQREIVFADGTTGLTRKPVPRPMPSYLSAYMMLLDDAHPTYKLTGFVPRGWLTEFPPIPTVSVEFARQWREERGITHADVSNAFAFAKGDAPVRAWQPIKDQPSRAHKSKTAPRAEGFEDPNIRQHSVAKIGTDGVRWAMLQLMADAHPTLQLSRREPAHQE